MYSFRLPLRFAAGRVSMGACSFHSAPMQDVTDLSFMRTMARIGSLPDVFMTAYFRSTPTTCAPAEQNLR